MLEWPRNKITETLFWDLVLGESQSIFVFCYTKVRTLIIIISEARRTFSPVIIKSLMFKFIHIKSLKRFPFKCYSNSIFLTTSFPLFKPRSCSSLLNILLFHKSLIYDTFQQNLYSYQTLNKKNKNCINSLHDLFDLHLIKRRRRRKK